MIVLIRQTTAMFTSFSGISSADISEKQTTAIFISFVGISTVDSSEKQTTLIVQMYPLISKL